MPNNDFSFNFMEMQIVYSAVSQMHAECKEEFAEMELTDPDRDSFMEIIKTCNSVLRKVKKIMTENGKPPITHI